MPITTLARRLLKAVSLSLLLLTMTACAFKPPLPIDSAQPFNLQQDLAGKSIGTGNFSAIDGTSRDFSVIMNGSWDGSVLTLVEDFEFADGVQERKTWYLTQLPNGDFSGVREDVVGTAHGFQDGQAFRLEYTMAIPKEDGSPGRHVRFKDILFNKPDGSIQNNGRVGLWGFRVGTVWLTIAPK